MKLFIFVLWKKNVINITFTCCIPLSKVDVENVRTPLFIIHSDFDYRAPIEQGEQFYTALKLLDRKVRFLRFLT
ncbi:alpha/beta hydrolase family protein [Paenibacillus peoriae]|uniref:alpha/beta hydrolase family protein n=1 Tax=Paenibacillus peoriae TaxID=59893 RepID=UPI001110AD4B